MPRSSSTRIAVAALIGMILGFVVPLLNGRSFALAVVAGVQFSVILAAVVAVIDWVAGIARRKGYEPLLGVLLAVFLNVLGIVVLLLLPRRHGAGGHEG